MLHILSVCKVYTARLQTDHATYMARLQIDLHATYTACLQTDLHATYTACLQTDLHSTYTACLQIDFPSTHMACLEIDFHAMYTDAVCKLTFMPRQLYGPFGN